MKTLIPFAALAAMLPLVPATAAVPVRTQTVSYADLDLASAKGRTTLDRRLRLAAEDVCGTVSDFDLAGQSELRRCRTETVLAGRSEARRQLAAANPANAIRLAASR